MTTHRQQAPRRTLLWLPARTVLGLKRSLAALMQALVYRAPRADAGSVLVYRIGSIGDFAAATAALVAIRKRHPSAQLHLLTNSPGHWPTQLGLDTALGLEVHAYDTPRALGQLIRECKPDALYYLPPCPTGLRRAWRDALFFRLHGVRRARGFSTADATGWVARALRPAWNAPAEHERLLQACGLPDPGRLATPPNAPTSLTRPYVILAPTGKTDVQQWPATRWLAVASALEAAAITPVWAGDETDAARLRSHGPLPGNDQLLGKANLAEVCGALSQALAFAGNDSGLAHLAALCATPAIVVSSARAAAGAWTPRSNGAPVLVLRKDMNCEACRRATCPDTACLDAIAVDDVLQALRGLGILPPTT
ncbi:MAG: glycosyltransferase family 9 protein [Planctomycetes bacterium]|nr:glycosyltransferase family 9 protein [Planctomycetota bacterium]